MLLALLYHFDIMNNITPFYTLSLNVLNVWGGDHAINPGEKYYQLIEEHTEFFHNLFGEGIMTPMTPSPLSAPDRGKRP